MSEKFFEIIRTRPNQLVISGPYPTMPIFVTHLSMYLVVNIIFILFASLKIREAFRKKTAKFMTTC